MARRPRRCPRCDFVVAQKKCLNRSCGWPGPKPEPKPLPEPMPPGCIVRCGKGHPIRDPQCVRTDKKGRTTEVTWRCKICSTEAVVTARGATFRDVPQREFLFEEGVG